MRIGLVLGCWVVAGCGSVVDPATSMGGADDGGSTGGRPTTATVTMGMMSTTTSTSLPTGSMTTFTTGNTVDSGMVGDTTSVGPKLDVGSAECIPDPGDDACAACLKVECCPELEDCAANPECQCIVDCVGRLGLDMLAFCLEQCMVEALPMGAIALQACAGGNCPGAGC